ncbi:hypothetical protein EVAR_15964_1 [Eumeta japonica]|uniref:Uncharacterized protein n=1 Tax=Eumeta variegata TaxID=151549 RepID=A0A4C1UL61_EUMVA|nr:hypothetical protein EVAR_15964_1 [Eumeta japonica]
MDLSPDEDNFPERLLHQAALWDNVELLQELLLSGYEVDARDACGRTALHAAALGERSRCLAALCVAGADVNARSDDRTGGGKTALHIAAERGHVENIETLLSAGATLTTLDAGGCSALMLAERSSHLHAIRLLTLAADPERRNTEYCASQS